MAHIDLGNFAAPDALSAREQRTQRTQQMLYASAIAAMCIVVVAALFITLLF
jgi:hypothetical protein